MDAELGTASPQFFDKCLHCASLASCFRLPFPCGSHSSWSLLVPSTFGKLRQCQIQSQSMLFSCDPMDDAMHPTLRTYLLSKELGMIPRPHTYVE
jgi:hypothetical protein